jgi:hypothetical protein
MEDIVIQQYHHISLRGGFVFARVDKGRRLERFTGGSVGELEAFIGKGKVVVLPRRDLVLPAPGQESSVCFCNCLQFTLCMHL